ncbi:MAG TPA: hypothetical protein VNJ71_12455 [Gemmatimonadales bacterium]|nr:hypothetical protein [Gemmatimonadales bacterium]
MINTLMPVLVRAAAYGVFAVGGVASAQDAPPSRPAGSSHADLFIASFGPAGSEPALPTSELEMREQVRLAFYGIGATRIEVEKGRLSRAEGDRIIEGFQQTLRNYAHDHSNDALIMAAPHRSHPGRRRRRAAPLCSAPHAPPRPPSKPSGSPTGPAPAAPRTGAETTAIPAARL